MRILQVIPYFYPAQAFGGPVKVAFDVGKELVRRGHEVVVFTSDAKDWKNRLNVESHEVEGMEVHYFRNMSMFFVKNSNLFLTPELLRKMRLDLKSFDLIHAHEYWTYQNIMAHHFARKYGVPYVLQAHGSLPKIGRGSRKWVYDVFFGHRILKDASKVIALNQSEVFQCRRVGVSKEKIAVIPNGIDLSKYVVLPAKGGFKKKFGIDDNNNLILYLGRIHKTKRIDLLIKAFAYLIGKMKLENASLVIAGPDDGYLEEVRSLIDSLNISDSTLVTGFISDKDRLHALVDAEVFVTPSFYGFPVTFLEACAVGTPLVTTTLGDRLDWINDNVGYVTLPRPDDLAKAIWRLISDDRVRQKLSQNCRDIVQSEFSIVNVVDRIEQVYREAMEK